MRNKEKAEIESIEQQLKLKGIDEVRLRIQEVQQALKEAEEGINHLLETIPQKKANQETCQRELDTAKINAEFWSNMADEWEQMVKAEIARGFVEIDEIDPAKIVKQLEPILGKYDRSKLNEQLTKAFINEQAYFNRVQDV